MTVRSTGRGCLSLVMGCVLLVGCQKVAKVNVQPSAASLDGAGKTVQFRADELDADGKAMSQPAAVEWSSDNTTVATIGKDGTATAKKSGRATLTGAVGAVKGQATLDVHVPGKLAVADVSLDGPGKTQLLAVQVIDDANQPMAVAPAAIALSTADPKVAMVKSVGTGWTVTAVAAGQTKITATFGSMSQAFNLTVKSTEVTDLQVAPTSLKLKVGARQKLTATAMTGTSAAPPAMITYASGNSKVATVAADGTVTGVSKGKTAVTVTAGAKAATVAVEVKK